MFEKIRQRKQKERDLKFFNEAYVVGFDKALYKSGHDKGLEMGKKEGENFGETKKELEDAAASENKGRSKI